MSRISAAAFSDTKPHYDLLDGLRGVAALTVVCFHLFEAYATSHLDQRINHGYLAVDFFFILSGFVVGYAYDDRWTKMTVREFLTRRLVRLQPMVVIGALIGAVMFYTQGCPVWDVSAVPVAMLLVATLMNAFMIPATPGAEIRGVGEMYPLNGPAWSLFFEYIGNIIYAVLICRLKTKVLAVLTGILGALYAWFVITDVSGYGNMGVGWTLDSVNFLGGTLRMMFPYATGMLLARNFKPVKVRGAFWICSLVLLLLFIVPYIPSQGGACLNGVFEFFCVAAIFPLLVVLGASGNTTDIRSTEICNFLGDISYPLYITHYPFMYLFYAWLIDTKQYTLAEVWPVAIGVFVWNVLFAWLCLRLYDLPVRKFLANKFLYRK